MPQADTSEGSLCPSDTNSSHCRLTPRPHFGRQLYKLSRQQSISGESFAVAAQVLLDKWAARGCDPKVLAKIRKDVFDVEPPKP
jgi:hypothetical protein